LETASFRERRKIRRFTASRDKVVDVHTVLTVKCKLQPSVSQIEALEETVTTFTDTCNAALKAAREHGEWRRFELHRLCYYTLRSEFGLSANLAVQAIRRVAKRKGKSTGGFKYGSVAYDQRTLSLKGEVVSLTTVSGRERIPLAIGNYQRHLLSNAQSVQGGQLVKGKHGRWYIHITVRTDVPKNPGGGKTVGIDLGQATIATLSNGVRFNGGQIKSKRLHYRAKRSEVRSKLDTERTRALKLLWDRLSGKELRFVRHTLHTVTRRIVDSLEPGDTIVIEDLTHLRSSTKRKGKRARYEHNLWPYSLFRQMLEYKALLRGIAVVAVDPRNTSRTCPRCGRCEKGNRRSRRLFRCTKCGFQDNADAVASRNIAQRAGSMGVGCRKPAPDSGVGLCPTQHLESCLL
jgi:putative transposase